MDATPEQMLCLFELITQDIEEFKKDKLTQELYFINYRIFR